MKLPFGNILTAHAEIRFLEIEINRVYQGNWKAEKLGGT
jgi:hypothetical protein